VVVQQDNGGDKEWLAIGPNPADLTQDYIYVTWTSFQATSSQLRFGRSIDGGATWTTKTIFAPPADPNLTHPQKDYTYSGKSCRGVKCPACASVISSQCRCF
jgi:hypothetical protein